MNALDGPNFVKWLTANADLASLPDNRRRALRRYRVGDVATVASADRVLTDLGLHLTDLPEDLWRRDNRGSPYPPELCVEAVKRARGGELHRFVASSLAVDRSTVSRWVREASSA